MKRVRVTVRHNPDDPADDLQYAARVRQDLWANSPVEIDPDGPANGTPRDADGNAYFEFATDYFPEVERVLRDLGHTGRVKAEVLGDVTDSACLNCGNVLPQANTVCPNCNFRDIEPCPYCNQEIGRLAYLSVAGDIFRCPSCQRRVQFRFNDPLFDDEGHFRQPVVLVGPGEVPAHGV